MRDLGGYPTQDGKRVKWGKLLRSGDLNELTVKDLQYLESIPLLTDIDFRSRAERENAPDKHPAGLKAYILLPIDAGDLSEVEITDATSVPKLMEEAYRTIIHKYRDEYKTFFRILAEEGRAPLLFHCSAGKDRTGIAAALILSALGVERSIILEDYLLSAECIKGKYDALIRRQPALAPLATVYPEYLQAAFRTIDEDFGGMEAFLRDSLEADIPLLKERYTE